MRKILLVMLCLVMVFCCTACSKNDTSSQSSEVMETDTFVKPNNYATILSVKDIPEFNFYLDEEGNILAVEPLSENAKEIAKNLNLKEKYLEKTIESILVKAHEKGYINDKATVSLSIDEISKEKAETDNILSKATQVITQVADDLGIQFEINNNSNESEDTNSKIEDTTSASSSKNDSTSTQNKHTHTFSAATCTQPKTCSCGEKQGNALGHKWIEATCKSPKTCQNCGLTNGEKAEHQYQGIYCKFCNNPLDKMSNDKWARIIKNNEFGGYNFAYFDKNVIVSGHCYTEEELPNDVEPFWEFEFKGIKYLVDGTNIKTETVIYSETNEEIIIDVYRFGECFVKIRRVSEQEAKVLINDTELSYMEVDAILKRG